MPPTSMYRTKPTETLDELIAKARSERAADRQRLVNRWYELGFSEGEKCGFDIGFNDGVSGKGKDRRNLVPKVQPNEDFEDRCFREGFQDSFANAFDDGYARGCHDSDRGTERPIIGVPPKYGSVRA